jgi:hypothetical protein
MTNPTNPKASENLVAAAMAVAQVQADQAGVTLGNWLGNVIMGQPVRVPGSQPQGPSESVHIRGFSTGIPVHMGGFSSGIYEAMPGTEVTMSAGLGPRATVDSRHHAVFNRDGLIPHGAIRMGAGIGAEPYRMGLMPHAAMAVGTSAGVETAGFAMVDGYIVPISVVPRFSVLQMLDFCARIDQAAMLLSVAFMEANVTDFSLTRNPRSSKRSGPQAQWYIDVVETCMQRAREVQDALVHPWTPTGRAERLAADAFMLLSHLSPAAHELARLYGFDRAGALSQLARQLEAVARQIELSARLLAEVEAKDSASRSSETQFAELGDALLKQAGGKLTLTESARLLGVSRQALHKRIKTGSVLAMMAKGATGSPILVLPHAQFVSLNGRYEVVPGLPDLLRLFENSGEWSALQFLVEPDPNLAGRKPLDVLVDGHVNDVLAAARAYLDIDGS